MDGTRVCWNWKRAATCYQNHQPAVHVIFSRNKTALRHCLAVRLFETWLQGRKHSQKFLPVIFPRLNAAGAVSTRATSGQHVRVSRPCSQHDARNIDAPPKAIWPGAVAVAWYRVECSAVGCCAGNASYHRKRRTTMTQRSTNATASGDDRLIGSSRSER